MRSGMAGKHDEMLIYILHSADPAATAGTNLLLSVEKSQCWRQAAQHRWTDLSWKCSDQPRASASSQSSFLPSPKVLVLARCSDFHRSENSSLVPCNVRFTVREEKWDSTGQQIWSCWEGEL